MINFFPGPSKVYPQLKEYLAEAYELEVLSYHHRSDAFMNLSKSTMDLLRKKLDVPKSYSIFFTSSATEGWEILSQSFLDQSSLHLFSGAFGEKWFSYKKKIMPNAFGYKSPLHRQIGVTKIEAFKQMNTVCITQNETSNGSQVSNRTIQKVKKQFSSSLVFVDATSSMAGIHLDWLSADAWIASVQKCFGLPSGLGLLVCSPKAIERAYQLNFKSHYNSLVLLDEKRKIYQTTYTPNTLGIFLLNKVLNNVKHIKETDRKIKDRASKLYSFLIKNKYELLIPYDRLRSKTVIAIKDKPEAIKKIKSTALKENIKLGDGYGLWKESTFRIANFPAITDEEMDTLISFLKEYRR